MGRKEEKKQKEKPKKKNTNEEKKAAKENPIKLEKDGDIITDTRFSSVHWDPRFQRAPKNHLKVALDSRFQKIFSDKSFSSSSVHLDKRGKRKKSKPQSHLLHYYHQEPEQEDEDRAKITGNEREKFEARDASDSESSESSAEVDVDEESESDTTSSSDDESDGVFSEEDVPSEKEDIPEIEHETHRLAIVNMDWKYVKAVDLYVVFSSDLPKGGQILSVAIYPSEFGLKCMEEESVRGPTAFFDSDKEHSEDEDEDEDEDEIDDEKLRAYEMSTLRYYYAVVVCDSSATADYLYQNFNGVEFERTSNKLDLRFIPDSMEFNHPPRDVATEAPTNYQPLDFSTRALQHTKIHLSWDDDEPNRKKILKRKFKPDQLDELELKEFLASDDGESDDDESDDVEALAKNPSQKTNKRDKYRALLEPDADDDDEKNMEVTFNTGLEDISKRILEKQDKKSETVWEACVRKKSEKKKARKRASKLSSSKYDDSDYEQEAAAQPDDLFFEESLGTDVEDDEKSSEKDSSKKNKSKKSKKERRQHPKDIGEEQVASREELELLLADDKGTEQSLKGKRGKEVLAEDKLPALDNDDPRFAPMFKSYHFVRDPTDPQFKRSVPYLRQRTQKQQKREGEGAKEKEVIQPFEQEQLLSNDTSSKKQCSQSDHMSSEKDKHKLSSLVRSVKRKVGTLQS